MMCEISNIYLTFYQRVGLTEAVYVFMLYIGRIFPIKRLDPVVMCIMGNLI